MEISINPGSSITRGQTQEGDTRIKLIFLQLNLRRILDRRRCQCQWLKKVVFWGEPSVAALRDTSLSDATDPGTWKGLKLHTVFHQQTLLTYYASVFNATHTAKNNKNFIITVAGVGELTESDDVTVTVIFLPLLDKYT